ncbi:AbrB/MazE/SpoVT family DNA-binding domain-containing protein [Paenisporosarcina quisquiliarum]|uniref:AbrB/MazE/SpoVT family DNA-binding domain-containing protein n=1 Tax=Paenisporosarcina quisquiliarum TaxID=365346 RepID=UPI003736E7AF
MNTYIRKIDSANRLKIPKEIIEFLAIRKGDSIEIFIENKNLILRKFNKEMRN